MEDYEIYEGITKQGRKKTYLVFNFYLSNLEPVRDQAKRYFRASKKHIKLEVGYVINDELYLKKVREPFPPKSTLVRVAYYI